MSVKFYDTAEDNLLKFAVIVSVSKGKWVLCKHKDRNTLEAPGGTREKGEEILETAVRELYEETGAVDYIITPVCVYSVKDDLSETFGMLYFAEINKFEEKLHNEIEKIYLLDELPSNWTYPMIQPYLIQEVLRRNFV